MTVSLFHVDAFSSRRFAGNPAAVCPLDRWLDDSWLQAVAAENNLSETAFFVPQGDHYDLRWFTPACEVKLCGHATLASAFVILNILHPELSSVRFQTRQSGALEVRREQDFLSMDFPALVPWPCNTPPAELRAGLRSASAPVSIVQLEDNYFVVYATEEEILRIQPDFKILARLHPSGVAITAPGTDVDFVSRYFAPSYGLPEDPVTGSTHCSLAPYWAERLGKNRLHARQVSQRGGEIWCECDGKRVLLKGNAVLTLRGSLLV